MPQYSEGRNVSAEVQAMAVDLVDRLVPLLNSLAEQPQSGAWTQLARATTHLQDFYERSFVELAEHPEPGRSQELADETGTLLAAVAHHQKSHESQDRSLSLDEKSAIAGHAATAADHLVGCLRALGDSTPGGERPDPAQPMTTENADATLRAGLDYSQAVARRLAIATLNVQS